MPDEPAPPPPAGPLSGPLGSVPWGSALLVELAKSGGVVGFAAYLIVQALTAQMDSISDDLDDVAADVDRLTTRVDTVSVQVATLAARDAVRRELPPP